MFLVQHFLNIFNKNTLFPFFLTWIKLCDRSKKSTTFIYIYSFSIFLVQKKYDGTDFYHIWIYLKTRKNTFFMVLIIF